MPGQQALEAGDWLIVVPSLPDEEADRRFEQWRRENDLLSALGEGDICAEAIHQQTGKRRYWARREALDRVVAGLYEAVSDAASPQPVVQAAAKALGRLICLLGDEPSFADRTLSQAAIDSFIEAWAEANG